MFTELNDHWKTQHEARTTYSIIPNWTELKHPSHIQNKRAEGLYLRSAYHQNDTNTYNHEINPTTSPLCKYCQKATETVEHWFLHCPIFQTERNSLRKTFDSMSIPLTLLNILGLERTRTYTLQFISKTLTKR